MDRKINNSLIHIGSTPIVILLLLTSLAQLDTSQLIHVSTVDNYKTELVEAGFFARHPKLRKFGRAAAFGAATGGLFGIVAGGSIAGHAVAGAGTRTAFTAAREARRNKHRHEASAGHESAGH